MEKVKALVPVSITPRVREEFLRFMEYHPAERFSKNLRSMLLEFLQADGAVEAEYLKKLLFDLEGLFALLDVIETEHSRKKEKDYMSPSSENE